MFASGTQNATAVTNFALSHVNASCSHSVSDVASTDGNPRTAYLRRLLDAIVTTSWR
ncbi:hypothetical protein KCP73_09495 [Salmonella enterica subsp. enterica]|nr:hypothetical protein KCP73_09495 [Salmonella enterica subsp. enterica]